MSPDELKKRQAHLRHVKASNMLDGVKISAYMDTQVQRYLSGEISSAELIAAAKAQFPSAPTLDKPTDDENTKPES